MASNDATGPGPKPRTLENTSPPTTATATATTPTPTYRYRDSQITVPVVNDGSNFFRSLVLDMYKTGKYSDFTIKVDGSAREFHVHRAVICPQSRIFEAACRGEFVEALTRSMTLTDDDPDIVDRMIRYLYTHRYDDSEDWDYESFRHRPQNVKHASATNSTSSGTTTTTTTTTSQEAHSSKPPQSPRSLHVYAIADKYLINPLKDAARGRFAKWASVHWSTPSFITAAREIFDNETGNYSELKEVVLAPMVQHADSLLSDQNEAMGSFLRDYSDVGVEVLRRVLEQNRIAQRGLEVDIADLQSRVSSLKTDNKKIGMLQSQNHKLNKELLEIKMVVLAWKKDLRNTRNEDRGNNRNTCGAAEETRAHASNSNTR
ncbi:BTB/POZ domain protein [Talaromyces islandicus]|uniref:BTB/POZ domain protein n=1 Tax=Talaromyces islandicus TaxID=28573 RepID=A0A0U1M4L7_TALIS|nr:BTB/POZ domain protein [Talaromyces islandicus]